MHEKEHGHFGVLWPEIGLITALIMIMLTVTKPDDCPVYACCPNKVQGSCHLTNILCVGVFIWKHQAWLWVGFAS